MRHRHLILALGLVMCVEVLESLPPGRTFVHCAQGVGRAGLFAAALLLHWGEASSVEEALARLTAVRPGIRLNRHQLAAVERHAAELPGVERR